MYVEIDDKYSENYVGYNFVIWLLLLPITMHVFI